MVGVLVTEVLGRDRAWPLAEGKREHTPDFRWCRWQIHRATARRRMLSSPPAAPTATSPLLFPGVPEGEELREPRGEGHDALAPFLNAAGVPSPGAGRDLTDKGEARAGAHRRQISALGGRPELSGRMGLCALVGGAG